MCLNPHARTDGELWKVPRQGSLNEYKISEHGCPRFSSLHTDLFEYRNTSVKYTRYRLTLKKKTTQDLDGRSGAAHELPAVAQRWWNFCIRDLKENPWWDITDSKTQWYFIHAGKCVGNRYVRFEHLNKQPCSTEQSQDRGRYLKEDQVRRSPTEATRS